MAGVLKYSVAEVGKREARVYYRVTTDSVELPGLIFIYASEKVAELNAGRLETGNVLRADLNEITSAEE